MMVLDEKQIGWMKEEKINHFTPLYLLLKKCYNKHQIESTPDNTMNKQVGLRLCLRERSRRL